MDRPTRRRVLATSATALAVGLAGCSSGNDGNSTQGSGNTVEMTSGLKYDPETITVSVGDTVTWKNTGSVGHSVTAYEDKIPDGAAYFASGGFDSESAARDAYTPGDADSGDIPGGESYEHTFDTAGTYEYFCIPHESSGMKGTVEVEE
jgi:plastocyanin